MAGLGGVGAVLVLRDCLQQLLVEDQVQVGCQGYQDRGQRNGGPICSDTALGIEEAPHVTRGGQSRRQPRKMLLIDVKKAHLQGRLKEDERAYIEIPGKPGVCGRLTRWLYGMRPAAGAWEEDYAGLMASLGFE